MLWTKNGMLFDSLFLKVWYVYLTKKLKTRLSTLYSLPNSNCAKSSRLVWVASRRMEKSRTNSPEIEDPSSRMMLSGRRRECRSLRMSSLDLKRNLFPKVAGMYESIVIWKVNKSRLHHDAKKPFLKCIVLVKEKIGLILLRFIICFRSVDEHQPPNSSCVESMFDWQSEYMALVEGVCRRWAYGRTLLCSSIR